ncbi:hypothetical protein B4070_2685 [Bacillus subtilis]|nr:hypothetical protein B4070_2685 [Bacillus subtilis]
MSLLEEQTACQYKRAVRFQTAYTHGEGYLKDPQTVPDGNLPHPVPKRFDPGAVLELKQ